MKQVRNSVNVGLISPEQIENVASFMGQLESIPKNEIAVWTDPKMGEDEAWRINLHPRYHPAVLAFIQALYDNHFVQDFDWPKWQSKALKYHKEPSRLSKATLATCVKLLTLHVRKERFVDGHFAEMITDGHIAVLLKRLAKLHDSVCRIWEAKASPTPQLRLR